MRDPPSRDPNLDRYPTAEHTFGHVLVTSALTIMGTFALVFAISYPVTALGVVALATGSLLAGLRLRRTYRMRRRTGRTRRVCLPRIDVCVEL